MKRKTTLLLTLCLTAGFTVRPLAATDTFTNHAADATADSSGHTLPSNPLNTSQKSTDGRYEYQILADGTLELTRFYGEGPQLNIPSVIDGRNVTSISFYNPSEV